MSSQRGEQDAGAGGIVVMHEHTLARTYGKVHVVEQPHGRHAMRPPPDMPLGGDPLE